MSRGSSEPGRSTRLGADEQGRRGHTNPQTNFSAYSLGLPSVLTSSLPRIDWSQVTVPRPPESQGLEIWGSDLAASLGILRLWGCVAEADRKQRV